MTVHRSSHTYFLCLLLLSAWLSCSASPAFSAEGEPASGNAANEGGLDSIWKDEAAPKNVAAASSDGLSNSQENGKDSGPISALDPFLDSDFVRMSPWPGIGPFTAVSANEPHLLTDAYQNRLNLSVAEGKITSLELELLGDRNGGRPFTNLEMSLDFLLEGLGFKPTKIHELNIDLESNLDQLTGKEPKRFKCVIDQLTVRIEPSEASAKKRTFRIKLASSAKSLAEPDEKIADKTTAEERPPEKQLPTPSLANVDTRDEKSKERHNESAAALAKPERETSETTPDKQLALANKDAALKQEFLDLIKRWQGIKKTAIRQGQTTELSQILSGPALAQQTTAVKWLSTNHKYYDMTPESATVEHFTQVVAGKEYVVSCQLKEHRKFIDGTNGRILKDSEENNHVIYTVKKMGNNWLIEDSNIVKPAAKGTN
jgi:hypothetical protein